jgi:hypothetical protein
LVTFGQLCRPRRASKKKVDHDTMDSLRLLPHPASHGAQDTGTEHLPGLEYTLTLEARQVRRASHADATGRMLVGAGSRPPRNGVGVRVAANHQPGLTLTLDN